DDVVRSVGDPAHAVARAGRDVDGDLVTTFGLEAKRAVPRGVVVEAGARLAVLDRAKVASAGELQLALDGRDVDVVLVVGARGACDEGGDGDDETRSDGKARRRHEREPSARGPSRLSSSGPGFFHP